MSRVVVVNHVTLDGVMQAPGRPDEDTRDEFPYGGWAIPGNDRVMGEFMAKGMAGGGRLLLGRRTYEDFASFWPHQPSTNPYADVINNQVKLVASRTLPGPLEWNNASLLEGDATTVVAELKQESGNDLVVLGSGVLVQSLLAAGLIDEFLLMIHPRVLGTGRKLFPDGTAAAALRLDESAITTTGVVLARYSTG